MMRDFGVRLRKSKYWLHHVMAFFALKSYTYGETEVLQLSDGICYLFSSEAHSPLRKAVCVCVCTRLCADVHRELHWQMKQGIFCRRQMFPGH